AAGCDARAEKRFGNRDARGPSTGAASHPVSSTGQALLPVSRGEDGRYDPASRGEDRTHDPASRREETGDDAVSGGERNKDATCSQGKKRALVARREAVGQPAFPSRRLRGEGARRADEGPAPQAPDAVASDTRDAHFLASPLTAAVPPRRSR